MNTDLRRALVRTLAFHETWGHAPTRTEWVATLESDQHVSFQDVFFEADEILKEGLIIEELGRVVFSDRRDLLQVVRENEAWAPRKRRAAIRVTEWLARLSSVRFVAVCNTTSLGHARDEGDLDFFVVTRAGTLAQTRGLAALPFKILGRRPRQAPMRDAVCLSYFVSTDALSLGSHMLTPDDPYFRYWFLSLMPLYDEGISSALWNANQTITSRHPCARPWVIPPDLRVEKPMARLPLHASLEPIATRLQRKMFPQQIHSLINTDTRVMVTPQVLKFHVDDGRDEYRRRFEEICRKRGIA